ncbi:MAG: hypothetical protein IT162_10735 [Bryobacterales bacterium]|nr:hypothetical protein [Bryobacterales bacterium]
MPRLLLFLFAALGLAAATPATIRIDKPMAPPDWALAERALLKAYAEAAEEFAAKYVDERGYFRCVERWGGNDGPDDVMETFNSWTLLHALGASDRVLDLYRRIWEGHLRQFTAAKAPSAQAAKEGMFFREFVTSFDWEHTGEGLAAFFHYALSAPGDPEYVRRVRRFTDLYTGMPNYDPQHRIVRSLLHGSRGPILTPASVFDWGGEVVAGHPERHDRYRAASNVRGDHPLNLGTCSLGFNAFALTGERKYKDWVLEYAGAWRDRIVANGGNIPTNIGLDGKMGGEWDGKWWGGTFGWNFDPAVSGRNYYMRGARTGLGEAFLLTGDASFIDPLRKQLANLYAAQKTENGRVLLPQKYGEKGWYGYTANQYMEVQRDLYLWSMNDADLAHLGSDAWLGYLRGKDAAYPMKALAGDFERLRRRVAAMRADDSTPDTRPSDGAQRYSPVATETLVNLMLGANDPGSSGNVLHARLRYFDPRLRRAGLPEDVAALVSKIGPSDVTVTLVNTSPVHERDVVVQLGAFAEHAGTAGSFGGKSIPLDGSHFTVRLAPGAGETLTVTMKRYANAPAAAFPWER